ncbi:hypothetical protein H9Q08_17325 [Chryseobacterium sp. PS-8]|uniref:Uncharacterized protein n=1 Tax=Chryseobacterium indicum TaxID=2766954 RepID=A0ABS9C903_9FLAO|nr:hypothetical protein [Chryseobacterium sp. PS-8]MCF2221050.1 hypothetical protein [Chryseobacterium sp. PS-8]
MREKNQETRSKNQEAEESTKQNEASQREQKLQKLREEYMSEEFILEVLESYQNHFLYALMKKDYENAKVNKFLQAFIDKKLLEMDTIQN